MKKVLLPLFLLICIKGVAQDTSSFELKPGIYRTVEDVFDNNPEPYNDLKVVMEQVEQREKARLWNISTYRLDLKKEQSNKLGKIFGFSDGENLYLQNYGPGKNWSTSFYAAEIIGPFIYYRSIDRADENQLEKKCLIDLRNRVFYKKVKDHQMRRILADKPEVKEKFDEEKLKFDRYRDYLVEYTIN